MSGAKATADEVIAWAVVLFRSFARGVASRDVKDGRMAQAAADAWRVHAVQCFERDLTEAAGRLALNPEGGEHG